MKKISILFFALASILFYSCEGDVEPVDPVLLGQVNNGNNTNGSAIFKVDFDGQTFVANSTQAIIEGGQLVLVGTNTTQGDLFSIVVLNPSVGTFPANENLISYQLESEDYGYISIDFLNPSQNTGSITITSITNNTISGTFNYTGYWTDTVNPLAPKTFTNGIFQNIPLTGFTDEPSSDSFYAKVNGTEFVEDQIDVAFVAASGVPDAISIVASKTSGERLSLSIDEGTPVGTYNITGLLSTDDVVRGKYLDGILHGGVSGSVSITSVTSTRIAGTFAFTAENIDGTSSREITAGSFDVELP